MPLSDLNSPEKFDYDEFILVQHILESSKESFVLINKNLIITAINSYAREISLFTFGKSMQVNGNFMDFVLPERIEKFLTIIKAVFEGETQSTEVVYPSLDKKESVILEVRYSPVFGENGKVVNALVQASDVTSRRNLERRIEQQKMEARRSITRASYQGQEKERAYLGKELHDNVNQILAACKLNLEMAESDEAARAGCIERSKTFINQAIEEIRKLSKGLVISDFVKNGMFLAMQELANEYTARGQVKIRLEKIHFWEDLLSFEVKINLYRILQEQLTNIIKYAYASLVEITLSNKDGIVTMHIKDDGVGFNIAETRKGIGFTNILNRAESLGGSCHICSASGQGCLITVSVPF